MSDDKKDDDNVVELPAPAKEMVAGLRDQPPLQPHPQILRLAEEILEAVKTGVIDGLAIVTHRVDNQPGHMEFRGKLDRDTLGSIAVMQNYVAAAINTKAIQRGYAPPTDQV